MRGHTFVACRRFSRLQSISRCINALLSNSHVENKNDKNQKGRARSVKTGGVFPAYNEVNIDSLYFKTKHVNFTCLSQGKGINRKRCLLRLSTKRGENALGWTNSSSSEGEEKGMIGYFSRHLCQRLPWRLNSRSISRDISQVN